MDEREWRLFTRAHPEFAGMAPGQTLADVAAAWLVEKRRVATRLLHCGYPPTMALVRRLFSISNWLSPACRAPLAG
jgi:hypothetical protein